MADIKVEIGRGYCRISGPVNPKAIAGLKRFAESIWPHCYPTDFSNPYADPEGLPADPVVTNTEGEDGGGGGDK